MADPFQYHQTGLDSPAKFAVAITPSDSTDLATVPRALFCRAGGEVRVTMAGGGDPVTVAMVPAVPLPLRVARVWATGTTATGIVGVW